MNFKTFRAFDELARLNNPLGVFNFKSTPQDFRVEEFLHYPLTGKGEHVFLYIEKSGLNTQEVEQMLCQALKIKQVDIGYAGLKDKQAVTRQWFSIKWPIKAEFPELQLGENIKILELMRHDKKLKKGAFGHNRFTIRLFKQEGEILDLNERLANIEKNGVPNYFGPQRFGFQGNNLTKVFDWFEDKWRPRKNQQSILLSSARSYLFNLSLDKLIRANGWPLSQKKIVLWGKKGRNQNFEVDDCSLDISEQNPIFSEGLLRQGLEMDLRATTLMPRELTYSWDNPNALVLSFNLEPGQYATSLLRELFDVREIHEHSSVQ